MKTVKVSSKKPAVSSRRGQWHKQKCFTVTLVLDPTLKKLDSNTIRKRRDIIEKKKVRIEKKNADTKYFRSVMYDNFPRLAGQEFSLWRMSGDKPELVPLPAHVNNAVTLCSSEELNRSHLYIKPLLQATVVELNYHEKDDVDDDDDDDLPSLPASLGYQHCPTFEQPLIYTTAAQSDTSLTDVVDAKTSGTGLAENKAQLPDVAYTPMAPYTYMEPMSVGSFQKLLADPITPVQYILPNGNFMPNDAPASSNPVFLPSYLSIDQIIRNGVPDGPNANQVNLSCDKADIRDIVRQSSHHFTSASSGSDMPAKRLKTDPHSQNSNQHQIGVVYQQASITNLLYTCNDIRAISCGICLKNLPVEPITLPCLELFCLNCLEAYIRETSLPSCPICQTYFHIPEGGLKDMPYNGFVEKVVDLRRIANQSVSDKLCEVCSKEYTLSSSQEAANIPIAENYCLDCHEKFCKNCTNCHKSMKISRHHNVVDLGLKSSDQVYNMWKQKEQFCKNHMKEVQKIHCHDCEQLVCLQCYEQGHSHHECTFFNETAEDTIKQKLLSNTEDLMKDIIVRQTNIDVMTNDCNQRAKDLELVREGIKWKLAKLKSEIDHCETELMLNCDEYQTNYIDKAKSNLEQHKQLLSKCSRLAGFMKLLKDLGSGFDLIRFNPTICQKTKNVLSTDFAFCPDKLQQLEFTPSGVTTDIQGLVGLLRLKPALEETCDTATLQSQNSSASVDNLLTSNVFSLVSNPIADAATMKLNQYTASTVVATNTTPSVASKSNTIAVGHVALTSSTIAAAINGKSTKENNLGCNISLGVLQSKPAVEEKSRKRNEAIDRGRSALFLSQSTVVRVIPGAVTDDEDDNEDDDEDDDGDDDSAYKGKDEVYGIAVLGSQLFIARYRATSVEVYDTNNLTTTPRRLKISDETLDCPRLAACSHYNCLYVSDRYSDTMYRVELSDSSVSRWGVRVEGVEGGVGVWAVSVTPTHTVLCLIYAPQVLEYNTWGELLREISLDSSIDDPLHCIQLTDGNFVICHAGSTQHRVCIVDSSGRIIKSYGGSEGSGVDQLNEPRQLSVDKYDHVFVADFFNDRVQLLSPTLTLLGTVQIPGHQLTLPIALHFDQINHRLYVSSVSDVLVVELSNAEM